MWPLIERDQAVRESLVAEMAALRPPPPVANRTDGFWTWLRELQILWKVIAKVLISVAFVAILFFSLWRFVESRGILGVPIVPAWATKLFVDSIDRGKQDEVSVTLQGRGMDAVPVVIALLGNESNDRCQAGISAARLLLRTDGIDDPMFAALIRYAGRGDDQTRTCVLEALVEIREKLSKPQKKKVFSFLQHKCSPEKADGVWNLFGAPLETNAAVLIQALRFLGTLPDNEGRHLIEYISTHNSDPAVRNQAREELDGP
jgi:hypothetical protein